MKRLPISFLFLNLSIAFGQIIEEPQPTNPSSLFNGLSITGHAYPVSAIGNIHKSFEVDYELTKMSTIALRGFYDTYTLTERFRSSLLGKFYLNEKLYLLSGLDIEKATGNSIQKPKQHRIGFVVVAGYDVSDNFTIGMKGNYQLNDSNIGLFGETEIKMPAVHTIGGKWKF